MASLKGWRSASTDEPVSAGELARLGATIARRGFDLLLLCGGALPHRKLIRSSRRMVLRRFFTHANMSCDLKQTVLQLIRRQIKKKKSAAVCPWEKTLPLNCEAICGLYFFYNGNTRNTAARDIFFPENGDETYLISALVTHLYPTIEASLIGLDAFYNGGPEEKKLISVHCCLSQRQVDCLYCSMYVWIYPLASKLGVAIGIICCYWAQQANPLQLCYKCQRQSLLLQLAASLMNHQVYSPRKAINC